MTVEIVKKDLFTVSDDYYLAQCISADFGMGKGIAVAFNEHFDMKHILQAKYPDYINMWHCKNEIGNCILEDRVLNLVTKERYWHKPSYVSLRYALRKMSFICDTKFIRKVAMPWIGCGLDKLEKEKVLAIIKEEFNRIGDMEILICEQ